ncbi:MAG: FxsB family cyclophane-forming radical SAM/SPASM peptide maturase [Streptosporangiaceae bacterium]
MVKVHSRCDLACDHCYVYEAADQSWRGRPVVISDDVISRTAQRIAEHATLHSIRTVQIVLHGGEPLLAGVDRMRKIITQLHVALRDVCHLDLRIHTNGVRLDQKFCELFAEYGVKVGISIDGDRDANDRHRRYANGRSSYEHVIRAIGLLRTERFRRLYAGLLCTIDIASEPLAVYDALMALEPPRVDFLLPHATWDAPPARTPGRGSQYADWLIAIFDRWVADGRPTSVRTFESILSTLTGGGNTTEALGLAPSSLAVIETDGSYEQVDSLKAAFDGAPATGFDVFSHALDAVARHPGIVARQQGLAGLCQECRDCPVVTSCGGGLYAHRYRPDSGFSNPSVYCADLLKLITHIKRHLPETAAQRRPAAKHALSDDDFRQLAAGYGTATATEQLIQAERTLQRALLGAVYQAAGTTPAVPATARETVRTAWAMLATADKEQPQALDAVLGHPYTRVWAVRCLEHLKRGQRAGEPTPAQSSELVAELGHLAALAAVIAIQTGAQTEVLVPVTGGAVNLPTLGRLAVDAGEPGQGPQQAVFATDGKAASIRIGRDCWELTYADLPNGEPSTGVSLGVRGGTGCWQPVRTLTATGLSVTLEDTDPYRDCHQWPAADRLTDAEVAQWQQCFADAWCEIERDFPAYVPAIATGLTMLMPLAPAPAGRDVSAAARHAFGAIGTALPADASTLALLIMHEFQHVKLGAILDLYDLYDPADNRLYQAPWREDMRPLEGLLQGTYAHLAVSEYWRTRQHVTAGAESDAAGERFKFWAEHTRRAIETLADSGSMTPLGLDFVQEMRRSALS